MRGNNIWVGKELTEEWDLVAGNIVGNVEGVGVGVDMLEQWEWSTVGCKCDIWGWGWCDCGSESELLSKLLLDSESLSASEWSSELQLLGLRSSDGKSQASVEYGMLVAKSSSVKMELSTGQAPLFLKADMIVDGWKVPDLTCMYSLIKFSFGILDQ